MISKFGALVKTCWVYLENYNLTHLGILQKDGIERWGHSFLKQKKMPFFADLYGSNTKNCES